MLFISEANRKLPVICICEDCAADAIWIVSTIQRVPGSPAAVLHCGSAFTGGCRVTVLRVGRFRARCFR
jgi:hypothetical protein